MKFKLIKVLPKIRDLYKLPRTKKRFDTYLQLLQGESKSDMILPIAGYNPMGKELATEKIEQLIHLKAEALVEKELQTINKIIPTKDKRIIQVAINLIDDVEGAWSNQYATDYKSKFELATLVKRNFCTPCFWTSETLTESIISKRVREYLYRTLFCIEKGPPKTLAACLEQEIYVQTNSNEDGVSMGENDFSEIEKLYELFSESTDYAIKFNFFYGDKVSKQLAYPLYGVKEMEGFKYAKFRSKKPICQHDE